MIADDRPPRWAERFLRCIAPASDARWIVADLEDEMHQRAAHTGRQSARWWYRRQVLASAGPLLARRIAIAFRTSSRTGDPVRQDLLADVRHSFRVFARAPLTTAAVVLTMVLGIAVTSAVFSVLDAVLIRPLPFAGSERTVQLFGISQGNQIPSLAYPDLMDFRRTIPAFATIGIVRRAGGTYVGHTEAQNIHSIEIDPGFVQVLHLRPAIGRLFVPAEYAAGDIAPVVLTHAFWQREFGGDSSVIGRPMQIDKTVRRIIGVLPETKFMYPTGPLDAVMPLRVDAEDRDNRGAMWLEALAELKPGANPEQAEVALGVAAKRIAADYPTAAADRSAHLEPLRDTIIGPVGRMLTLLTLAVAAVLLTACMNVGNLLLAQAATRAREFAVRAALGGSVSRIRRQVLTETLVLAAFGGGVGLLLASPLSHALVSLYPGGLPRAGEVHVSVTVVVVAIISTIIAALLASLPTLRRAGASGLTDRLRSGTGGAGSSADARRLENFLIATQMAATLALVFVAALMVRTFVSIRSIEPGFDPRNALSFIVEPSGARHPGGAGVTQYYGEAERALAAVRGVTAVTTMSHVPFAPGSQGDWFYRDDIGDRGEANPRMSVTVAETGFDRVIHLTVLEGRSFTTADDSTAPRVVMINERLAKQAFSGVDPVGKTIHWSKQQWRVVGVVGDVRDKSLTETAPAMIYASYLQRPIRWRWMIIRSSRPASEITQPVRAALHALDPTVPLMFLAPIDDRIAESTAAHRFRAWLIGSLGALAAILAVLGVYAVVSQSVTRRTREIGIRIALGQDAAAVQRNVVKRAVRVAIVGSVVGAALSLAIGRSLSNFLYAVDGHDPVSLVVTSAALLVCCAAASFFPARRASRVDPVIALRAE